MAQAGETQTRVSNGTGTHGGCVGQDTIQFLFYIPGLQGQLPVEEWILISKAEDGCFGVVWTESSEKEQSHYNIL